MSDIATQLQTAFAKIAQLEEALSKSKKEAPPSTVDLRQLEADPIGTLAKHGANIDHYTKHFVANAMGDQAPAHLKEYVKMGQQLSNTTQTIESKIESLGRRLDEVVGGSRRESFQKLAADKDKYPHLAAAYAADPSLFEDEVSQGSEAAEIATKLEARLAKLAPVFRPPTASAETAATDSAQVQQAKPAPTAGALQGDPPPIVQPKPGAVTDDVYAQIKAEVVSQYDKR